MSTKALAVQSRLKIGYCRVSTQEQSVNSNALEQQTERVASQVDRVLIDVQSGKSDNRENLQKILDMAKRGEIASITITRLDRLSRKLRDVLAIVDSLTAWGFALDILDLRVDTSTAAGKVMLQVMGSLAEFESSMLTERVNHGMDHRRSEGKPFGHPPLGYRLNSDKTSFEPDRVPVICTLHDRQVWYKWQLAQWLIDAYLEIKSARGVAGGSTGAR